MVTYIEENPVIEDTQGKKLMKNRRKLKQNKKIHQTELTRQTYIRMTNKLTK